MCLQVDIGPPIDTGNAKTGGCAVFGQYPIRAVSGDCEWRSLGAAEIVVCGHQGVFHTRRLLRCMLTSQADVETRRYAIRSLANIVTQSSTEGASLGESFRVVNTAGMY